MRVQRFVHRFIRRFAQQLIHWIISSNSSSGSAAELGAHRSTSAGKPEFESRFIESQFFFQSYSPLIHRKLMPNAIRLPECYTAGYMIGRPDGCSHTERRPVIHSQRQSASRTARRAMHIRGTHHSHTVRHTPTGWPCSPGSPSGSPPAYIVARERTVHQMLSPHTRRPHIPPAILASH